MSQTEPQQPAEPSSQTTNPFQRYLDIRNDPLDDELAADWDAQAQPGTPG